MRVCLRDAAAMRRSKYADTLRLATTSCRCHYYAIAADYAMSCRRCCAAAAAAAVSFFIPSPDRIRRFFLSDAMIRCFCLQRDRLRCCMLLPMPRRQREYEAMLPLSRRYAATRRRDMPF